jgi:hypothetical protein
VIGVRIEVVGREGVWDGVVLWFFVSRKGRRAHIDGWYWLSRDLFGEKSKRFTKVLA